jgi:ATP-dependent RNA helicase DDX49/DBP8
MLMSLARDPGAFRGLVLTPSRELAVQVKETIVAVAGRAGSGAHHLGGTRVVTLTGGYPIIDQLKQLSGRPHIVVATPGRLAQIIRQASGNIGGGSGGGDDEEVAAAHAGGISTDQFAAVARSFKRCHYLVLDEADRLLASEFAADIGAIISALPPAAAATANSYGNEPRQTLLFSATMTKNMQKLAKVGLATSALLFDGSVKHPIPQSTSEVTSTTAGSHENGTEGDVVAQGGGGGSGESFVVSSNILQQFIFLPQNVKDCYLVYLIRSFFGLRVSSKLDTDKEHRNVGGKNKDGSTPSSLAAPSAFVGQAGDGQVIVFVRSCVLCEELAAMLQEIGVPTCRLHAWMKQPERKQALDRFKSGLCKVMVATDVAHRGLDIQLCRLVIQYNLPQATREYVHRVGRTGRTHSPATALLLDDVTGSRSGRAAGGLNTSTGQAIALVDQFEVKMLLTIENEINQKLGEFKTIENQVLTHLNDAITARELGRLRLDESGFYETAERIRQRKQNDPSSEPRRPNPNTNPNKKKRPAPNRSSSTATKPSKKSKAS